MICCTTCNTEYVDFLPSQAHGCAAEVIGKMIYGFYGSIYIDGEAWTFDDIKPEYVKDGIIVINAFTN